MTMSVLTAEKKDTRNILRGREGGRGREGERGGREREEGERERERERERMCTM